MNRQDDFRDRLIASQQSTPEYRERYRRRLDSMLTRELSPARRVVCGVMAVIAILAGISLGVQTLTMEIRGEYAAWGRMILGLFAAWAIAFGIRLGSIAIRGTMNLRKDRSAISGMRLVFFIGTAIVLLLVSGLQLKYEPGSNAAILNAVIGLAFLAMAVFVAIRNLVQQSELNVQEKLLEIELRLAEVNEKLEKGGA